MSRQVLLVVALGVVSGVLSASCAARRVSLPIDAGAALPDATAIHEDVSRACRGVRTFTAELALSGRVGATRLRGRVVSGFARPASMRLEGVAPFGPPGFILATGAPSTILLLPRDSRVLTGAAPDAVLGALTGVSLGPADLLAILTGCVMPAPVPRAGRVHGNGWASIDLEGDGTLFLTRSGGGWQVRAARRRGWQVEYAEWQGGYPRSVALHSIGAPVQVDLSAQVDQIEANIDIPEAAFTVVVPPDAAPLTLDELRDAGPLRGK